MSETTRRTLLPRICASSIPSGRTPTPLAERA